MWSPIPDPAELYPRGRSSSQVPFMAESCLDEPCSDKMEKELQRRLKGGRRFRVKGKPELGSKVTPTASGNPRDDKSFRVAQQQKTKAIPGGGEERGSAEQTRNLM